MFIYSAEVEFPANLVELEAELHEAENQLAVTSLEHKELLQVVENIKRSQQSWQRTVDIHNIYIFNFALHNSINVCM